MLTGFFTLLVLTYLLSSFFSWCIVRWLVANLALSCLPCGPWGDCGVSNCASGVLAESCCAALGTLGELLVGSRRACASAARRRFVISFLYWFYEWITHLIFVEYICRSNGAWFSWPKEVRTAGEDDETNPAYNARASGRACWVWSCRGASLLSSFFSFL